jgi:hypothetical protein
MKRLVLLGALAVVLGLVIGLYSWNALFASSSNSNIEGPSSGYLTYYPSFKGEKETMIFLVSTDNPRYGFYNWSDDEWWGGEVHEGDPCFIVNVTARNDYTTDPIWTDEDSPPDMYNNHVKLTAHLYDQQGRVDAVDVTYPINSFHGGHVFKVEPEETHSVTLYLATDCKDIDRYEIYVTYIGPAMEP